MPLEEYRRKRDFDLTKEPRGARPSRGRHQQRRYVVQKHRASRLHYDFRLEIGGVLVSWAVPRGPSMQPLAKRRAARTEDHPIEYVDFEGVIPIGEYGGGDVIVWDQGTWQPEGLDDPAASIEDGELKFILDGERLRGRFVLVRTSRDGQTREDWLLIHKTDAESDPNWDIRDYETSVLTGRTNEQVAAGRSADGRSSDGRVPAPRSRSEVDLSAATRGPLPSFVPPMLATATDRAFSHPGWLFELKLDGYRVEAIVDGDVVRLRTRNGKDGATYFPAFAAAQPSWLAAERAVIDGEMVALDAAGRPSFSLLQDLAGLRGLGVKRGERASRPRGATGEVDTADAAEGSPGQLIFHVFDVLHLDGLDLLDVALEERKHLLQLIIREHPSVRYVSHVLEHGEDFQRAIIEQGLEGSVAKLRHSRYEAGRRSHAWLKIKVRREQELVVVGYEPGQGSHRDLGALLVATWEGSDWRFAGEVGSGMDAPTRKLLRHLLDEHATEVPPVAAAPQLPGVRWSEPRHVIRAEYTEWTTDGLLRQASYKGRDLGRDPRSVTRESIEPLSVVQVESGREPPPGPGEVAKATRARHHTPMGSRDAALELVREDSTRWGPAEAVTRSELEALAAMGPGGRWEVGRHVVQLSNLDKVLFPGAGFTKRDLVRYYTTIAPVMLPYLRDRPLNVDRWPDGVTGRTHFWQKQIPSHAPDWVARWDYPEAGHDQSHTYVVADRVATMAWLANQAVIDMHPWTSRLPEYSRPTYALVDIDPGERTTWEDLLTLARLYRTALGHLGVRAFPKVTGKRGVQVWIHVEPRYTYDETRDWVGELSRGVAAVVPDLVSWEWGKADRAGRARLDYTQNSIIKTLVAPYAVRPVPSAAVSTPITWDELDDPELRPDRWDIESVVPRVEQIGDLFSGVLDDPQALPPLS